MQEQASDQGQVEEVQDPRDSTQAELLIRRSSCLESSLFQDHLENNGLGVWPSTFGTLRLKKINRCFVLLQTFSKPL